MDSGNIDNAPDYGIALLRISLGFMWVAHALLKLLVFTLPGTAAYFTSVGLPGVLAYPVFAAELVGGAALIVGIRAQQVSLALVPILIAAAWVHFPNGWVHTSPHGGWEYPAFLIVGSVALAISGDGALVFRSRSTPVPVQLRSEP
ncbi:MAG: DoxX family protein [Pseudomonadota bacterium]|nr:DoxX family protein [Pseudomonadota bacterium]